VSRATERAGGIDPVLPATGTTVIPPDPEGLLEAMSRIGYSTPEAIGDLVDNSIDADAGRILVRVLRRDSKLVSIVIVDDGDGMSDKRMDEAMGFGVRTGKPPTSLGKYGMGLKSASFSQCSSLTVMSRNGKGSAGRRWTIGGVRNGWECERIDRTAAGGYLGQDWFGDGDRAGTIIRWDELDAFRVPAARAEATLTQLFDAVSLHLGLIFHRFLERDLRIDLDSMDLETGELGVPHPVRPRDPFAYRQSGDPDFPLTYRVRLPNAGALDLDAHIWPRLSQSPNYLLGRGQVARRQGFYFYRNDRLIQGGGWNGVRGDAEPHMSLARVRVDLPAKFDSAFSLNIQKSGVHVPEGFDEVVMAARTGDVSFADYLASAQKAYRKKGARGPGEEELVPGSGLPAPVRRRIRDGTDGDAVREVPISWKPLPEDRFFSWDRERMELYLNERYRRAVLNGRRGSAADAPLVKALLFSRLEGELHLERISSARQRELDHLQVVLVAAARQQEDG
jgi:hypothetical protein